MMDQIEDANKDTEYTKASIVVISSIKCSNYYLLRDEDHSVLGSEFSQALGNHRESNLCLQI